MNQPAMLPPHTISRKRISCADYRLVLVLLPDSRRICVTLTCLTSHPLGIVSKPELAIFQNIIQVFFVSRQADCIAGKIKKPSFQFKQTFIHFRKHLFRFSDSILKPERIAPASFFPIVRHRSPGNSIFRMQIFAFAIYQAFIEKCLVVYRSDVWFSVNTTLLPQALRISISSCVIFSFCIIWIFPFFFSVYFLFRIQYAGSFAPKKQPCRNPAELKLSS